MTKEELEALIGRLLAGAGLNEESAGRVCDVFVRATLRGVGHHDVYNLPGRLELVHTGRVKANPELRLLARYGALETYDGDSGLGELCCSFAMDRAMALAREHGLGLCAVRRSNHFLAAAPYVERAAENGFFALVFTNTIPCMSGAEGTTKIIGNNPMGFAVPSAYTDGKGGEGIPLLFDIAMSYASWGKIDERIGAGEAIPALWARDGEGRPTTDPVKARDGGTVTPMAEHKGFGLAVMNELLTAGLAGGEMAGELVDSGGVNTHSQTALAVDVGRIVPLETFLDRSATLLDGMRSVDPTVRPPGQRSARCRRRFLREGIELSEKLLDELDDWARRLGVSGVPPECREKESQR